MKRIIRPTIRTFVSALVFLGSSSLASCAHAQNQPKSPKPLPAPALLLAPLAGAPIAVLPASYVIAESGLTGIPATRALQLAWVDSIVGEQLETHGPEARWLLPAELRRTAKRAPGMVTDPDQMGQASMRYNGLKKVPDPLFGYIRSLVALTGSRFVMIPAAFRFTQTPTGVQVEATYVLTDARSGLIPWRSIPVETAPTAAAALTATIARILPDLH